MPTELIENPELNTTVKPEKKPKEVKEYYMGVKTIPEWRELYYRLSGTDIFHNIDFGDNAINRRGEVADVDVNERFNFYEFQERIKKCAINIHGIKLIKETNKIIQGY